MGETNRSKVSIIVPAYNCEAYLGECLDSVLAQTYPYWECVVVDDGSTDKTFAVAESYSKLDGRIHCFRQENQGPSVARNNAIRASFGEFLLPVDADDRIVPTYVEKCVEWFLGHPETTLVYGLVELFGERRGVWNLPDFNYESFIWRNTIICSAMYKKSDFDRVGGYNPQMRLGYEDWDFWLSMLNRDSVVHRIDEVMYYYRICNSSRSAEVKKNQVKLNRLLYNNHLEIYAPYTQDIISIQESMLDYKARSEYLENELLRTRNSRAFKTGKFLLRPLSWLKHHP